jgi:predicted pyridoxine 5'-phosphate oxidase superfamily flavin-nucleotide-binding protein
VTARPAIRLSDLHYCFEGAIPAVIATADAQGRPNVTYLSRIRLVDDERVALSNQFFSKTSRNLAENPRASVLLVDPTNYDEFRLTLAYERTDRRGPVFDRLREDVEITAALEGMQDVFKLRAADIYRVVQVEQVLAAAHLREEPVSRDLAPRTRNALDAGRVAQLSAQLNRCGDLDTLVETTVRSLSDLFGYDHTLLLLLDEHKERLYTIAGHGFDAQGVGSEIPLGEGVIGTAATRCTPVTVGNLRQLAKYSRRVRRSYEQSGELTAADGIPVPALPGAQSKIAVPAMAMGELVGVLSVESEEPVAFGPPDEALLMVVASIVANAIEGERARERSAAPTPITEPSRTEAPRRPPATVRFFAADGSTFLDGDYLIKGVAGRILWSLLRQHADEGRIDFTNREVRLDPTLELPEFRDNFESRLILLKRRLDEHDAPIRIEKTGRGRFRLLVHTPLRLDLVDVPPAARP